MQKADGTLAAEPFAFEDLAGKNNGEDGSPS